MTERLFTSESVSSGHPDKLCDQISDGILDACIRIDPFARVAVETLVKGLKDKSLIVLGGEVTVNGEVPDYEQIARDVCADVGECCTFQHHTGTSCPQGGSRSHWCALDKHTVDNSCVEPCRD